MSESHEPPLQPTLAGRHVELRPIQNTDGPALLDAAKDGRIWELKVTIAPGPDTVDAYVTQALEMRASGTSWPYVILRRETQQVVGSTRLWKMNRQHRKLEIGWTWLSASAQRTAVNTECKYLLLKHAFEELACVRVQFQTDELNERSQNAIMRLGAKREGIIRHERIMPDGRKRNSVRFSIIDDEWEGVKRGLEGRLGEG